MVESTPERGTPRDDVLLLKCSGGALSLEFVPLREGVCRAFLRFSPRNLKLSRDSSKLLSLELARRGWSKIIVQDNRRRLLSNSLRDEGWRIERAVPTELEKRCSMCSTYDIPLDENLKDEAGSKPDLLGTSHMHGLCVDVGGRNAFAFYTDDGETARVVSEGERRQGMFVSSEAQDIHEVADCLVRFLASARKTWAVFSMDSGRFVRKFDPITMWRMSLDGPRAFDHGAKPLSGANRRAATKLFSEYYDESYMQAMFRLRRFRADRNYSTYLVDGGFVITRTEGEAGLIYDIYVTPARQGEGLGAELMRCALSSFAGRVASVHLHTSYPRAKRLYEKFGFKVAHAQLGVRLDEVALYPPDAPQSR